MQMDTDATPRALPSVLALENGFRRAVTGSDDEAALIASGYTVVEHDGTNSILRRARRSSPASR